MSNAIRRRCAECGELDVVKVKRDGPARTYKNVDPEVPADVEISTCETAGSSCLC